MKVKLKEIGKIITGNTPSKQNTLYYNSNDILFIKPDVLQLKKVCDINDSKEFISENARAVSRIVPKGSLLITCIGIIGKIGIVGIDECAFNQQINAIVPNNNIKSKYLAYVLFYNRGRLNDIANAPVVPIINKSEFENFEVNIIGDIKKQESIIQILDKIENIIYKYECVLNYLDTLIKARFVEMFGDIKHNDKCFEIKRLYQVCNGIGDGLHGTPEYVNSSKYAFINGNNLVDGKIGINSATKYVSEETYIKNKISLDKNTILISINGTLGNIAFYNNELVMLGKSVCYCNLNKDINKYYVYHLMKSNLFIEYMETNSTMSTIKNVGLKAMREYNIVVPPIELQNQFATFVKHIDKLKFDVQKSLEKTQMLFDSLMQEYFG